MNLYTMTSGGSSATEYRVAAENEDEAREIVLQSGDERTMRVLSVKETTRADSGILTERSGDLG